MSSSHRGKRKTKKGELVDEDRTVDAVFLLQCGMHTISQTLMGYLNPEDLFSVGMFADDEGVKTRCFHEAKMQVVMRRAQENFKSLSPFLGMHYSPTAIPGRASGVLVLKTLWNCAAQMSGLMAGDVIVTISGRPVTPADFQRLLRVYRPADTVSCEVIRSVVHTINTTMHPTYGGGRSSNQQRLQQRAEEAREGPQTLHLTLVIGALDYTMEETRAIRRIADGHATPEELDRIAPMAMDLTKDVGPSKYVDGPDSHPEQAHVRAREEVHNEEEAEAPPLRPVTPWAEEPGQRTARFIRKTDIAPGPSTASHTYETLRTGLDREYAAIDRQAAFSLGVTNRLADLETNYTYESI